MRDLQPPDGGLEPLQVAYAVTGRRPVRRATTTLLIATLSMAALPAAAQQGAAEVRGRVLDAHAGLLPRATVVLRNQQTGMFRQVVSGASGIYFLSGVTPGIYELSAELAGFNGMSSLSVVALAHKRQRRAAAQQPPVVVCGMWSARGLRSCYCVTKPQSAN